MARFSLRFAPVGSMKALVAFCALAFTLFSARVASAAPAIDLYTVGTAPYLWARWGHTVICATEGTGEGTCYDFAIPEAAGLVDMVWGTWRGQPRFKVERISHTVMHGSIAATERTMEVQRLPLAPADATALAARLEQAYATHFTYVYSPRLANCSSLVRDMIDDASHGALRAARVAPAAVAGLTYREITEEGLSGMAPTLALLALVMGSDNDVVAAPYDAGLTPLGLRDLVTVQFGVQPTTILDKNVPPVEVSAAAGRALLVAVGLALAALAVWVQRKKPRRAALVRKSVGIFLGVVGLIPLLFLITTKMPEFQRSWVVLLLVPFDAALGFISPMARRRYGAVRLGMGLALVLLSAAHAIAQPLIAPALLMMLPVAALLATERYGVRIRRAFLSPATAPGASADTRRAN